jgi:hypothetical protein
MNQRTLLDRLLSPAGFGLVLLLFLFPFATVACSAEGASIDASFTGLDFVVGGEPSISGANVDSEIGPELSATFIDFYSAEPLAIIAAVLLLAGMAVAVIRERKLRATTSAAIAAVVLVLLVIEVFVRLPSKVDEAMAWFRAQADLQDPIDASTSPTITFWIAIALLLALAGWQGYEVVRARSPEVAAGPSPVPPDQLPSATPLPAPATSPATTDAEVQESWRSPEPS